MPKQEFSLQRNAEKRLVVTYDFGWKNISISLDGQLIGKIPDKKALQAGQKITLPDQSTLELQWVNNTIASGLDIRRNGMLLPGSLGDPYANLSTIAGMVYFFGGINIVFGVIAVLLHNEFLLNLGIGSINIGIGIFMGIAAYFIGRKSVLALTLFIVYLALDAILLILSGASTGLILRTFMGIYSATGYKSIKQLKQEQETKQPVL